MEFLTIQDKQKICLDALLCLDEYCRKHELRYYLNFGTLIGAIRHHGFIPWDDDVDVYIPRPDYETILQQFEDSTGCFKLVSCFNEPEYFLPWAKIQSIQTARLLKDSVVDQLGIGIDLFPLDGFPDDLREAERIFRNTNRHWLKITNRLERFRVLEPNTVLDKAKSIAGQIAFKTGFLKRSIQKLSQNPFDINYDSSKTVGSAVGLHSNMFRAYKKEWFETCYVEFEGHKLAAPKGYHEILTMIYGDYMQLPPEEKRVTTHTDKFIWI